MTVAARRPERPGAVLHGPFRLLWAGQSVSLLGDGVFLIAFSWQVAVVWHRPGLLGGLLGVRILAELATLLTAGWVVDRVPRRTLVLGADLGRGLLLFGLAAAVGGGSGAAFPLAVLIGAYGVLTSLFRPTLVAFLPELVSRSRLQAANSLIAGSTQIAVIAGPAVGAALVGLGSPWSALVLDGVSFLVAAACTLPLPGRAPKPGDGSTLAQAVEGFGVARRVGWIGGTILVFSVANFGMVAAQRVALPLAAADRDGHLAGYGGILAAIGVGAVLAALMASRTRPLRHAGQVAYGGVLMSALAVAVLGLTRGLAAALALGLAVGFGQQLFELLWTTGLQHNVPDRLLGRVSAVDFFGSFALLPASFALGGLAVQHVRPERFLLLAGLVAAGLAVLGLAVPALHDWRPLADPPGPTPADEPGPAPAARAPLRRRPAGQRR